MCYIINLASAITGAFFIAGACTHDGGEDEAIENRLAVQLGTPY